MQYLYEEQYYVDRYDLATIKECLEIVEMFQKVYDKSLTTEELKDITKQKKYQDINHMLYWYLFPVKTEEYKRKQETIQKWMQNDRLEQEKYDQTLPPPGVYCPKCKICMAVSSKFLENYMDEPLRVLFFFDCPSCKKRRAIYEDGTEHLSKPDLCPKCKKEVKVTHKKKGNVITWKTTCASCGFVEKKIDDFDKMRAEREKKEQEEKALLQKYRQQFCFSDEEGKKAIENSEAMVYAQEVFEEEKEKYAGTAFQQTIHVKKLSIVELEKLLTELFEKNSYVKLVLDRPEIGQFVLVPFTAQDAAPTRSANTSTINLQTTIKGALDGTNWRLVNNSIDYRLGYVSGKLKGYEREEDILELYEKKKEQKPTAFDNEKRMKYGGNNWVQIARITGKYAGIEAVRKKRLENEPDGFFLEATEGSYTCGICGDSAYGNDMWWNLDGMRCRDCWRNIQEGVIPPLPLEKENVWIHDWELKHNYDIHPATARKLRKQAY